MDALLNQVLEATKAAQVTDLLEAVQSAHRISWLPVGDIDNNFGIINMGKDPAGGLIERVTNALDAVIERRWQELSQPAHLPSPRAAVREWWDVPDGKLGKVEDLRRIKDDLAEQVTVTLLDGDRADLPTLEIRDLGVGLRSQEFKDSILGLNKNRKLQKRFLAGAFGQGGSTALAHSEYTLIVSRHINISNSKTDPVAATVVRFNPGNIQTDKHGRYEYLIDKSSGFPMIFDASEEEFPAGTLVRHVAMQLSKYTAVMTAPTGSLWFLAHNYLFDPVIPFTLEEKRSTKGNARRSAGGNHRLLSRSDSTEYKNSAKRTFNSGEIEINWWVIKADSPEAKNRITQYTMASQPIIVTYNGQKQGYFPNTLIKNDLKLPYLDRYIVVHVDCDGLDNDSRRQLFTSTRESLKETQLGDNLRQIVLESLQEDDNLRRLDHERKQRYVRNVDSSSLENIRRRLAKRVNVFARGSGRTSPDRPVDVPRGPPGPPPVAIPVQDPPTFIRITNANPRPVYAGRTFTLKFETDAKADYFRNPGSFIAAINPPSFGSFTGVANILDGHGKAFFKAAPDVEIGMLAEITLEVRPPISPTIRAQTSVKVAVLPDTSGENPGAGHTPNITPHWVGEGDDQWDEWGWDESSVAKVMKDDESINVFVSSDNSRLSTLIGRAQRHSTEAVDAIKEFYLEHISYHALIAELDDEQIEGGTTSSDDEHTPPLIDIEMKHANDTLCGIIESLFNMFVAGTIETEEVAQSELESSVSAVSTGD
jgi:hypothetical protein